MRNRCNKAPRSAFSLVELLVAAAIGAAVITAAVIGFAVVGGASIRGGRVDVQLPGSKHADFYGSNASYITVWPNPNYSEAAKARLLRDKLVEDCSVATAVFVLGRNGNAKVRPSGVNFPAAEDFRTNASPAAFRLFLIRNGAAASADFAEDQAGRLETTNATILLVGGLASQEMQSGATNRLGMVATYELDFVRTSSPSGVYSSVRRYDTNSASVPTDFYHAFYPDETNATDGFRPVAVHFGRPGAGGDYAIATNHPFTFIWWPDPLISLLGGGAIPAEGNSTIRLAYGNMAARTSLFSVLPMFPGQ